MEYSGWGCGNSIISAIHFKILQQYIHRKERNEMVKRFIVINPRGRIFTVLVF